MASRKILKYKDKKKNTKNQSLDALDFEPPSTTELWDEELNAKFTNR